jgi:hypothetical protein
MTTTRNLIEQLREPVPGDDPAPLMRDAADRLAAILAAWDGLDIDQNEVAYLAPELKRAILDEPS